MNVRKVIDKSVKWRSKPVVFDNAIRCAPGATKIKPAMTSACRPHTARVLFDTEPKRILCFGLEASETVLGRRVSGVFARRGHGWHFDEEGEPVPVFFLPTPQSVLGNKIQQAQFESDILWALEYEPPPPAYEGTTYIVESEEDSIAACQVLRESESIVYDVETRGRHFNRDFELVALTVLGVDDQASYTWGRGALADPDIVKPLQNLLEDPSIGKIGQNVKYDDLSLECAIDAVVPNTEVDTRLWRKLGDSFAQADLETLAELAGMGGHKEEAHTALDRAVAEINRQAAPEPAPTKAGKPRKKRAAHVDLDIPEETLARVRGGIDAEAYAYAYLPEDILLRYNARDVWTTRNVAIKLTTEAPKHVRRMWNEITRDASVAIRHIEGWGFACDADATRAFSGYCGLRLMEARSIIEKHAGPDFNPASPKQLEALLFDKFGLRAAKTTASGARSTDASVLESLSKRHPIVDAILEFRRFEKLDGTYARGMLPHIRDDGRIHPSYLIDGTDTGRLSCFPENVQVLTARGTVRIIDVRVGDMVLTHCSRWRRVLAVLPQGHRLVEDFTLSTGAVLSATADHRMYTTDGQWVDIGELADEHLEGVDEGLEEPHGGRARVPRYLAAAHSCGDSEGFAHDTRDDRSCAPRGPSFGGAASFSSCAVLGVEDRREEPDARQDSGAASQLDRGLLGLQRVPDAPAQREAGLCASDRDGRGAWSPHATEALGSAPHRRESSEQHPRQPGAGDACWAQTDPHTSGARAHGVAITARNNRRACQVFDLTVEEDESFVVEGVIAHNCRDPNLQNLPRAKGSDDAKYARNCFVAAPGHVLLEFDFSQIELRVAAYLSKDKNMTADFKRGIDIHANNARACAPLVWKITHSQWDQMTKDERDPYRSKIKTATFGRLYGKPPRTLAREWGVDVKEVEKIDKVIWGRYSDLEAWTMDCVRESRRTGVAWTYWKGEPALCRPIPQIASSDEGMRAHAERTSYNCLDDQTEALTRRGWVRGFDLTTSDTLLTKNAQTGELEWQRPSEVKKWDDYEGDLIEFRSRSFSAVSTPDHRWLINTKAGQVRERVTRALSDYGDDRIHRTGHYAGVHETFSDDFVRLAAWVSTDGSWRESAATICQSESANPWNCAEIDALLQRLGSKGARNVSARGIAQWHVSAAVAKPLHDVLDAQRRPTMQFFLAMSGAQLRLFRDVCILADGWVDTDSTHVCARDAAHAEMYQVLSTLTGGHATIHERDMRKYGPRHSPKVQPGGVMPTKPAFHVSFLRRDTTQVLAHQKHTTHVQGARVWCPIVPNTFFVARRAGTVYVTGNTPVQGTAAHYTNASLWPIVRWILKYNIQARVVCTVHDSIMLELREIELERVAAHVREVMTGHFLGEVPILVDAKIGPAWGEMVDHKLAS